MTHLVIGIRCSAMMILFVLLVVALMYISFRFESIEMVCLTIFVIVPGAFTAWGYLSSHPF